MHQTLLRATFLGACALLVAALPARAALLIGTPVFTQPVFSQLGPVVGNTLTITPLPNGFSVAGQVTIQVAPGSAAGVLASWEVEYPIDPSYANAALFTSTSLLGFSQPPPGPAGNTAGSITSSIVTLPNSVFAGSTSQVPMSLVNGIDNSAWNPTITGNSGVFSFVATPGMVLRQRFDLDGIYGPGPGGQWVVDVPVVTFVTEVPEPSSLLLAGFGAVGCVALAGRRLRSRRP
jgi:hypothetical protein